MPWQPPPAPLPRVSVRLLTGPRAAFTACALAACNGNAQGVVDETACEVLGACMARRFDDEGANSGDRCLHFPELCFQLRVFFLKLPEMCGQSFFRMPPANSVLKLIQVDDRPDTDGEDRTVIFKAASGFQDIRFGDCRRECPDFQRTDLGACSVSNRFIVMEGRFEVDPCLFDGFALGTLEDALFRLKLPVSEQQLVEQHSKFWKYLESLTK